MRHSFAWARAFAPLAGLVSVLLACSSSSDGVPAPLGDSSTTDVANGDTETTSDTTTGTDSMAPTDSASTTDTTGADGTPAGDTWDTFAMGFFAKYCVECHAGGKRDYRTPAQVTRDLALIRCGTASVTQSGCTASSPKAKQFPIDDSTKTNPKPTDAERDRLIAWLAAGTP